MDVALFLATTTVGAVVWSMKRQNCHGSSPDSDNQVIFNKTELYLVDKDNETISSEPSDHDQLVWCRATYTLVMQEPPHLFYEPNDWSVTTVLLLRPLLATDGKDDCAISSTAPLQLPAGPLWKHENYHDSAIRHLKEDTAIDVSKPENYLHHLFTFPFEGEAASIAAAETPYPLKGVWGDFYECVYRGKVEQLQSALLETTKSQAYSLVPMTLAELQEFVGRAENSLSSVATEETDQIQEGESSQHSTISFTPDTLHALKL